MTIKINVESTTAENGWIVYIKRFDGRTNVLSEPVGQARVVLTTRELCMLVAEAHAQSLLRARIEAIDEADVVEPPS